jgi:hypothetical protein
VEWANVFSDGTEDLEDYFTNQLGQRVHKLYTKFKDKNIVFTFTAAQQQVFEKYKKAFHTNTVNGSPEYSSIVLRHAVMEFRIAMLLTLLRYEHTLPEASIECSNIDFTVALILGFTYFNHAEHIHSILPGTSNSTLSTSANKLMAVLPNEFKTVEAIAIGLTKVKIKERQTNNLLGNLVACGLLEKTAHGIYKKLV